MNFNLFILNMKETTIWIQESGNLVLKGLLALNKTKKSLSLSLFLENYFGIF